MALCLTSVGFIFNIWLVSVTFAYMKTCQGPSEKFQEVRSELKEYVAFKRIPEKTQKRILNFYDFSYKCKFFRQKEVDELLESHLRNMISKETSERLLLKQKLFSQLPLDVLHSIAMALSETIYLKNDVISSNNHHKGQVKYQRKLLSLSSYFNYSLEIVFDSLRNCCCLQRRGRKNKSSSRWKYFR